MIQGAHLHWPHEINQLRWKSESEQTKQFYIVCKVKGRSGSSLSNIFVTKVTRLIHSCNNYIDTQRQTSHFRLAMTTPNSPNFPPIPVTDLGGRYDNVNIYAKYGQ